MQRRSFLRNISLFTVLSGVSYKGIAQTTQTNGAFTVNGKVTGDGKALQDVVVSDGFNVVTTNSKGEYTLPIHDKADFMFISLPSGFEFPERNGIPQHYRALNRSKSQQTENFSLNKLKQDDNNHAFIIWADTQIKFPEDATQLKNISAPDTKDTIKSLGNLPVHGISVGDLVWDQFDLFPDYADAVASTGIPFFQVIGNHDMDIKTARTDDGSQQKFKELFGPTYYSFNRGKVHYVVLDDVFFIGVKKKYIGYLTEEQLAWLEKDLSYVPKDHLLIISLHIPTNTGQARREKQEESMGGVVNNRSHLYNIVKGFNKVHIMSGHTHWNENWEKANVMEHNHGTVCGAWWTGPVCTDGTPNGYGVYHVNGTELSWQYKPTGKDINHQLRVYNKGAITNNPNAIMANVWNYDKKWKVEWLEDNVSKGAMTNYMGYDPVAYELYYGPELPTKHKGTEPILTDHLFIAEPSPNAKQVEVRVTDRFGKVYSEKIDLS